MKPTIKNGIHLPQIPKTLTPVGSGELENHEIYSLMYFSDQDFFATRCTSLAFDQVFFQRTNFGQTNLNSLHMGDCRLERCDLSAAEWMSARLRRVELSGCRMLGTALAEGMIEDVIFQDCLAERVNFTWTVFKGARFEKCDLREAAFLGADMRGVVFQKCDLSGADMRDANLAGADLRGAVLDGIKVGLKDLQGVILTTIQAVQVLGLLDVKIKELDEE